MKKTYEEKKKAILSQNKHYINAVLYIGGGVHLEVRHMSVVRLGGR